MSILIIFFTALLVGLSGAVMPGPLLSVNIFGTLKTGIKGGLLTVVGHALAEAVIVVSLLIGLSRFLSYGAVQGIIGIVGGSALVWMGISMLKAAPKIVLELETTHLSGGRNHVFQGLFATVSNPYWYIWWATVGLNYISISRESGIYGLLSFYFGHISSDLVWFGFIILLVARGITKVNQKIHKVVVLVLGTFLALLGISFVLFGISKLM